MTERRVPAGKPDPAPDMPLSALHQAAKLIDAELERQISLHASAVTLRDQFGATVQAVLAELSTLEARREDLAAEVGRLETLLIQLRSELAAMPGKGE